MRKIYKIDKEFINTRFDRWFRKKIVNIPQSLIEKNIRKSNFKVNNKKIKSSYKLQIDDEIKIENFNFKESYSRKKNYKYQATKKELSFTSSLFIENNEDFAVINKPAGIPVQSGTKSHRNILDIVQKTKEFDGCSAFPVHRIDKETTGILIIAKNRKFAQLFTSLFRIRKIHKTYICIILGKLKNDAGLLEDNLFYFEGNKKIIAKAITRYKVLDTSNNFSLLKLHPTTGRKHQLRKQLLIRGCPVLGDNKYRISLKNHGKKNNLMLHAYQINFSINNLKYKFTADLPNYFKEAIKEKYLKIY